MALRNAPKILRGAFVEFGLSLPPLFVVFQFNPVELSRSRSLSFAAPNEVLPPCPPCPPVEGAAGAGAQAPPRERTRPLREWHKERDDLLQIQKEQKVTVQEETLSFDIRLDATDRLEEGDPIAATFGVLPQLATLELMAYPKEESLLGAALGALLGSPGGFSFTKGENPPLVMFIWGHKRVLPVNITSMNIRETEFSTLLDPVRATVSVSLSVIEGRNPLFTYSKVAREVSSVLNLANIGDIANVVVPG
ncbi:MAG TPA: hypothetical protein VHG51_01110 [Longimicrobiaceae bacterium]|nr:hypothetical protein [Longimicrobiaceae bacterium]